jgi:thiol-disulfide isomerase/thioredoxin
VTTGQWVLLVSVLFVVGFSMYRVSTDGRFRGTHRVRGSGGPDAAAPLETTATVLADAGVAVPLGERATLVQFSSAFCAPCRATRRVLGDVAALVPGVTHVEVDAEHHLEAVRALRVLRTPTTLVLDAAGHEVSRAAGLPERDQVLAALGRVS